MALCEKYVARQTIQPDQWIVADDGNAPAKLTMGQEHIVRSRTHEGGRSLAANILAAIPRVAGDVVILFEHDDWYAPNHIEVSTERLRTAKITGSRWQRYYNLRHKSFRVLRNEGSALCNTAMRAELLPKLEAAANYAFQNNAIGLDRALWDSVTDGADAHSIDTVVGLKGLPGRVGLGMGHRPDQNWWQDPALVMLEHWVGADKSLYFPSRS